MVYIKRVVTADITRQIGLNQEVSDRFFQFNPDTNCERYLRFTNLRVGSIYTGSIKKTGHSITITGDIFAYVKENCRFGDIIIFRMSKSIYDFDFKLVRKGSPQYDECDRLLQCFGSRNNTISSSTHLVTSRSNAEALF